MQPGASRITNYLEYLVKIINDFGSKLPSAIGLAYPDS